MNKKRYYTPIVVRFFKRGAALLLDIALLLIFFKIISTIIYTIGLGQQVYSLIAFWLILLYFPYMHARYGQTLGKKYLNLQVVDVKTARPIARHAFLRMIWRDIPCKLLSHVLFGLGFLTALFTHNGQALHDILANTLVIEKK